MTKHTILTLSLVFLTSIAARANQELLAASIKEARKEATRTTEQLKTTLDSLTALAQQKEGDLGPAFTTFTTEIPRTQNAAAWTKTRLQWMQGVGQAYFQIWQKTIDGIANESLKKKAQKRLDAAKKSYAKVETALKKAGEQFNPFLSDLDDIQKVLTSDLTAAGIKNIKSTVGDANWRYKGVNSAMKDALKEMEKMEKQLTPEAK